MSAATQPSERTESLLQVRDLEVHFTLPGDGWLARRRVVRAVDGVCFNLRAGRTLGVVGESGCGKSTLARALLGLVPATGGSIRLAGEEITGRTAAALRPLRRKVQMVFQDPFASLDPRMTLGQIIAEPLRALNPELDAAERRRRVRHLMERVGLAAGWIDRYPHEFSGGQCQRIGIARALACGPELLVCDEPVSALDVSVQAQIVNLLMELQRELGLALLFIAHDLAVVRQVSHEVMVMYLGRQAELAPAELLYRSPRHPYTRALLDSVPLPDPERERARQAVPLAGDPPSPLSPPAGCAFHTRCPRAQARCRQSRPALHPLEEGRQLACHFPLPVQ